MFVCFVVVSDVVLVRLIFSILEVSLNRKLNKKQEKKPKYDMNVMLFVCVFIFLNLARGQNSNPCKKWNKKTEKNPQRESKVKRSKLKKDTTIRSNRKNTKTLIEKLNITLVIRYYNMKLCLCYLFNFILLNLRILFWFS